MVDPILMLAGDDLNEVDECWEGIHDQIRAGLLGSLEKELRNLPDDERKSLRKTLLKRAKAVGRDCDDWIMTTCQIYGSVRRCSPKVFDDAAVHTEMVLLMYLRVCFHAQVQVWKNDLPDGTACRYIAEVLCGKHHHLRNAIAHARWELTKDGRIRFEDRYGNGEVSWGPKDYSLTSVLIDGLVVGALAVALSGFLLDREEENQQSQCAPPVPVDGAKLTISLEASCHGRRGDVVAGEGDA